MFQDFIRPSYAGFWIRVLAYVIDSLLMMAVSFPLGLVIGFLIAASGADDNSPLLPMANLLINGVSSSWDGFTMRCSLVHRGRVR